MSIQPCEADRMTLTAVIRNSNETVTMSSEMAGLEQVLETIERFLRASGYNPDGYLTFIKDEFK